MLKLMDMAVVPGIKKAPNPAPYRGCVATKPPFQGLLPLSSVARTLMTMPRRETATMLMRSCVSLAGSKREKESSGKGWTCETSCFLSTCTRGKAALYQTASLWAPAAIASTSVCSSSIFYSRSPSDICSASSSRSSKRRCRECVGRSIPPLGAPPRVSSR